MAISITLTCSTSTTADGTVKLSCVTTSRDVSSKVFAIEVFPRSADTMTPQYRFSHVCSPAEMAEFPEDAATDTCYFRVNSIEMLFDNKDITEHVISNLKSDIQKLVRELKELQTVPAVVTSFTFE